MYLFANKSFFNFRMNCYKEVTVCLEYLLSKQQNTQNNTSLNLSSTFSSNVVQEQMKVNEPITRKKAPYLSAMNIRFINRDWNFSVSGILGSLFVQRR